MSLLYFYTAVAAVAITDYLLASEVRLFYFLEMKPQDCQNKN